MTLELAPFASVEAGLAADTHRMLANAVATTFAGGEFAVIFDREYQAALGGQISATLPAAEALDSDVSAYDVEFGAVLTIRDVDYKVRDLHPDGCGKTLLILETA